MRLCDIDTGRDVRIVNVGGEGALRSHLLDMGMIPDRVITLLKRAPMGDPLEVRLHSYSLTLRMAEAAAIDVTPLSQDVATPLATESTQAEAQRNIPYNLSLHEDNAHPGIGEAGKYHSRDHAHPLPDGTPLTFALVGQQNCGKTTLFNYLTGSNQHVGNFPGVTVERKEGAIKGLEGAVVIDLPGIYSLSTYTTEESVARDFILREKPRCIINIVDAGNMERNLYLTLQLMELEIPQVLAVNMMDELTGNGGSIRVNEMERLLGIPIVPISASKGEGIDELMDHAVHIAMYQERPSRQDFCSKEDYNGAVHRCLHGIMHLVEGHADTANLPKRFVASRLVVGDEEIKARLGLSEREKSMLEDIIVEMERQRGLDRTAAMAEMRYTFIERLCNRTVVKPKQSRERVRSNKIDQILTGRFTAIPAFIAIIALVFWATFDKIGVWLQYILGVGIDHLAQRVDEAFIRWQVSKPVRSLVVDAIFGGVGSVLSFVPIIIVLFFFLSMLEDSGYMARIAFVSDKMLRKIGLSGRSIVPMLISFGCSVPGVMATRTLPSARDRKTTMLLIPFMSCSAKIAIYGFFASTFFPGHGGTVMVLLYLLGIVVGIAVALVRKWLGRRAEAAPFVMELPVYRLPNARNVWHLLWEKTKDFVQKAFTVIFIATIAIWLLQSFDFHLCYVEDSSQSILARISGLIAPLFAPMGLDDWRIVTSLVAGFTAKEGVVSTLQVLGVEEVISVVTAVPMLIFCLLYTPCAATIAAIRRELGGKWALFVVVFQCTVAWVCAWLGYLVASAL